MRVVSNAAILWAVRVVTLLSSGTLGIIVARALGPAGRGAYVLPAIDASIATTFGAGLSSAAAYFLLSKRAGSSFARAAAIIFAAFIGIGIASTFATAAVSRSVWAIVPAVCFVVAYGLYSLAYGYFLGIDRARYAALLNASAYLLTLALVSAALFLNRSSPKLAIAGWVAGMGVAGAVGAAFALRDSRRLAGAAVGYRDVLRFALRAGLVNLVNLLNYRVDIFVIAIFTSPAVVGLYTLAVTGAESVLSMTQALATASLPRISSTDAREAGLLTARCLRNGIFLAFILASLAFVSAPFVIRLAVGPAYAGIVLPLRVLLIGLVAASTSSIISNYFVMNKGRTHVPLWTSSISAVLCASISYALVPKIGMLGAAIGSTTAYCISQSIAIIVFCRESGIAWPSTLFVDRTDFAFYRRLARRMSARAA